MRKMLAVAGSFLVASADGPAGESPRVLSARRPVAAVPTAGQAAQPSVLDCVADNYRELVAAVVKAPTMTAKAEEEEFTANAKVYDWLLEHPDRACTAWQRLKVPCLDIADLGKGTFKWSDDAGSELTWQTVGRFENGTVWYATGKVKAGTLIPTVPVRAVAVLHAPRGAEKDAASPIRPTLQLFMQTDSKMASTVMRVAGPAAPKMAEQGAEQLLFFFSGIARYAHKKPDQAEALLAPPKK